MYEMEEVGQEEADRVYELCDAATIEAREWMEEMEDAYSKMRVKEIVIIDKARRLKPFTEDDHRCIYEFIKEIRPLDNLFEEDAVGILTEELLSPQLQQSLPPTVTTLQDVHWALVGQFGNLEWIVRHWVRDLEEMAATRRGRTHIESRV